VEERTCILEVRASGQVFAKTFSVSAGVATPLDETRWRLAEPRAGSRQPLLIQFDGIMDAAICKEEIAVVDLACEAVACSVSLGSLGRGQRGLDVPLAGMIDSKAIRLCRLVNWLAPWACRATLFTGVPLNLVRFVCVCRRQRSPFIEVRTRRTAALPTERTVRSPMTRFGGRRFSQRPLMLRRLNFSRIHAKPSTK